MRAACKTGRRAFSSVSSPVVAIMYLNCCQLDPSARLHDCAAKRHFAVSPLILLGPEFHCSLSSCLQSTSAQAGADGKLFDKILIANRGEVSCCAVLRRLLRPQGVDASMEAGTAAPVAMPDAEILACPRKNLIAFVHFSCRSPAASAALLTSSVRFADGQKRRRMIGATLSDPRSSAPFPLVFVAGIKTVAIYSPRFLRLLRRLALRLSIPATVSCLRTPSLWRSLRSAM
jgi:hypothetical protein